MARIQLLPETLRNQIAAGEVIERPAAVVKELVENALDAGAKRVQIDLRGRPHAGPVRDDGAGMAAEDALLASSGTRPASSRPRRTSSPSPATASAARRCRAWRRCAVTLLTCEPEARRRARVVGEGGATPAGSPPGAPPGTTVEVRDLFWNVPARRKFLKRAATEQAQCLDAVLRLALPRPDVHFTVRESQRVLLQLPAGENVIERRAEEALGREVRGNLHRFAGETRGLRAHGLAVSPAVEYGSARNVWLFVNGRAVRDRSLTHAVLRAYGELMPHGRYPGAIVFVEVPPAEVDVNVHPAKAEVRLADPRAAWDAIYGGPRAAAPAVGLVRRRPAPAGAAVPDAGRRASPSRPRSIPRRRSWCRGPGTSAACAISASSTAPTSSARVRAGWC